MYSVRSMPSLSKTPYTHIGVSWVFFPSMVLRKKKVKKGYLYTFLYTYIKKYGKAEIRRIAPTYILHIHIYVEVFSRNLNNKVTFHERI